MKRVYLLLVGLFLLVAASLFYIQSKKETTTHTHFHAGFVVYIKGEKQDYSASQFMHVDMCSIEDKQDTHTMQEENRVHLHNNIGDVAHIHADGVTWGELFKNAGITLPADTQLFSYRNGQKISESILDVQIEPYESVILSYGTDIMPKPADFVSKNRILEVEKLPSGCEK